MIQFADCLCRLQNSVVAVPGGYGMQAVALRIAGNKAMFYRVRILGTQDTLLDDYGSHYFFQCYVQGSIDFIFGSSRSLYQVFLKYVHKIQSQRQTQHSQKDRAVRLEAGIFDNRLEPRLVALGMAIFRHKVTR